MLAFIDSRAALRHVREHAPAARILCDNPLLANAPECRSDVEDISILLGQDEATRLGEAAVDILLKLEDVLLEAGLCARHAGVERPISITPALRATFATLLHRGLVAARATDATDRAVLLCVRDEPRWEPSNAFLLPYHAPPQRTLAHYGFFGAAKVETTLVDSGATGAVNDTRIDSLAIRVAAAPLAHVGFYALKSLRLNRISARGALAYGKRCEMLDETLPYLAMRGFALRERLPPAYAPSPPPAFGAGPVNMADVEGAVFAWLQAAVVKLGVFSIPQTEAVARVIVDHLSAGLAALPETRRRLESWADRLSADGVAAFLSSGVYGPRGTILHDVLARRGIDLIDFEHGVTMGIAKAKDRRIDITEANNSDILLACSPRSAARFARSRHCAARRIESVGNCDSARKLFRPGLQRFLARRRLGLNPDERVLFHVSTLVCGGNARAADDAPAESMVFAFEKKLIEDVYRLAPMTVLFKPYPARRFPDEVDFSELFASGGNTRIIGSEDFRYVRAAADVIVTQANSSTIGWCAAGNIPLVHLYSRRVNALAQDGLLDEFRAAFFTVDTDRRDWDRVLAELLSMPAGEMAGEWAAKRPARQHLLREAIAGPDGVTGRRAARVIAEEVGRKAWPRETSAQRVTQKKEGNGAADVKRQNTAYGTER